MNCTDKFLKHSERVGARFAEQNAGAYPRVFSRRRACERRELSVFFMLMLILDSRTPTQRLWVPAANRRRSSHARPLVSIVHCHRNSFPTSARLPSHRSSCSLAAVLSQ